MIDIREIIQLKNECLYGNAKYCVNKEEKRGDKVEMVNYCPFGKMTVLRPDCKYMKGEKCEYNFTEGKIIRDKEDKYYNRFKGV